MPDNLFSRSLAKFVDVGVLAAGWWLIVLSAFTCVEMVARKFFRFSLQGVDEVGGYTLAVISALGFSYTLITRGHTRIDFLLTRLPAGAARRAERAGDGLARGDGGVRDLARLDGAEREHRVPEHVDHAAADADVDSAVAVVPRLDRCSRWPPACSPRTRAGSSCATRTR